MTLRSIPPTRRRPSTVPAGTDLQRKTERLNLRLKPEQETLLRRAALIREINLTEFVIRSATNAATDLLADRTTFVLPRDQWDLFIEMLDRAPRHLPRLTALLAEPNRLDE